MKYVILFLISFLLLSFFTAKEKNSIPNEWVQYLGEDSIKYTYSFKDSLGCKILQKIIVEEPNKGNGGKKIFSNTILFDASGKVRRVGVTRSVNIVRTEYENGKSANSYSYDQDVILFEKDSLFSFTFSNIGKPIIDVYRNNNYLYAKDGLLYRPIYDYLDLSRRVECKYIGKGVSPKLDSKEFADQTKKGIYRKYRKPIKSKGSKTTTFVNTIQVER